jgi:3',5'-cyclic AMP phosphodiesterase CpdA
MIEALLNPSAVEKQVARLKEQTASELSLLEADDPGARARAEESGSKTDLEQLEHELDEYRKREAQDLSGANDPVWIPRDPVASLVLSVYDEFLEDAGLVHEVAPKKGLAHSGIAVSNRELEPAAIEFLEGQKKLAGQWLTKYGERDVRFLSWGAAAKIAAWLRGKHQFSKTAPPTYRIDNRDRVLLVGDWGSGIPRALQVSAVMRTSLEQALRDGRRCHVIHLGDVYYTGQPREYEKRFLDPWPVRDRDPKDETSSWCLNGNHDMYSGGYGYFETVLGDPRFNRQGKSSLFCIENSHWQILGLDSAYDDGDLHGSQASWVQQMRSAQPQKAGILLSHHQPFSSFERSSDKLLDRVRPSLNAGLIRAWFWGHEHRCAAYEARENIHYPRLVGHGGVPVWAPQAPAPPGISYQYGTAEDDYFYRFGNERFLRLGFAELTFEDKQIEVRYINEMGMEAKSEVLRSDP